MNWIFPSEDRIVTRILVHQPEDSLSFLYFLFDIAAVSKTCTMFKAGAAILF